MGMHIYLQHHFYGFLAHSKYGWMVNLTTIAFLFNYHIRHIMEIVSSSYIMRFNALTTRI